VREWIHVSDHVRGIQLVLQRGKAGEVYNVGTGTHLTNNDLASAILLEFGLKNDMKSYVSDRKGHDFRYSVDSSKISHLGFEVRIALAQGLRDTIDWYKNEIGWWESSQTGDIR
jgi:dTDP-glucose 4,6-dehydratase